MWYPRARPRLLSRYFYSDTCVMVSQTPCPLPPPLFFQSSPLCMELSGNSWNVWLLKMFLFPQKETVGGVIKFVYNFLNVYYRRGDGMEVTQGAVGKWLILPAAAPPPSIRASRHPRGTSQTESKWLFLPVPLILRTLWSCPMDGLLLPVPTETEGPFVSVNPVLLPLMKRSEGRAASKPPPHPDPPAAGARARHAEAVRCPGPAQEAAGA